MTDAQRGRSPPGDTSKGIGNGRQFRRRRNAGRARSFGSSPTKLRSPAGGARLHRGGSPGRRQRRQHRALEPTIRRALAPAGGDPRQRRRRSGACLRPRPVSRSGGLSRQSPRALCAARRQQRRPSPLQGPPGLRADLAAAPARRSACREDLELPRRHPAPPRRVGAQCGLQHLAGGALRSASRRPLSVDPQRDPRAHAGGELLHRTAGPRRQPDQLSLLRRSARGSAAAGEPRAGPYRVRLADRPASPRLSRGLREAGGSR